MRSAGGAAASGLLCATAIALAALPVAAYGRDRHVRAHAAHSAAPSCVPAHNNSSDRLPGTPLQVSPLPGARDANPGTQISFLGAPANAISGVTVRGSLSGVHSGRLMAYSQGDGASFVPARAFTSGDHVTVRGSVEASGHSHPFAFSFDVDRPDPMQGKRPGSIPRPSGAGVQSFVSAPGLRPPTITVERNDVGKLPGYVFAAPYGAQAQGGPMIFDGEGQLVWFHPLPTNLSATDLKTGRLEGKPVITWWQGYISPRGFGMGQEEIADSHYNIIHSVSAANGLAVDLHGFGLYPDDTASFTAYNTIHCDLSAWDGPHDGALTDGVLQVVDLKTGLVRREWHSLDHVPPPYSYSSSRYASAAEPWDYFHINSIQRFGAGNYLISSRNTWAVYEISGATGTVQWTVGGMHPTFRMGPHTRTVFQHDAVVLPDHTLTIFDNGGTPKKHGQTRLVHLRLDFNKRSVSLISSYTHTPSLLAGSQGDFQALTGGYTFSGWGAEPYFSEFDSNGRMVWDARLATSHGSYRGFLFGWVGTPAGKPAVGARSGAGGALTIYASWNGATQVARWQALAGPDAHHLAVVATAPRSGFETALGTTAKGPYVQVRALDAAGRVIGTSPVEKG